MESANIGGAAEFAFVSRRNHSLVPGRFCLVLGCLALISLAIAVGFALLGAWLVLPFAGAEVLALAVTLRCVMRGSADYESVAIEGDRVVLDIRQHSDRRRLCFNRLWAQLVVRDCARQYQIALRSHGREIELGRYLDEPGRRALARELRARLRG